MSPRLRAVMVGALLLLGLPSHPRAQEMQFEQSALIRRLLPMVVNITAVIAPEPTSPPQIASAPAAPPPPGEKRQLGSGFVIDPSGVIVTNYHVINGAFLVTATFSDGTQLEAKVLSADRLADIALLKVEWPKPLPTVRWADSRKVQIGDEVLAIGNPLGVGLSVTGGIVSALDRDIMETPYDDYIQTDAPINHGNSGGPLFNMNGEVVGINTALISPTAGSAGLGFAIPSRDAQFVIGQLKRYGWVHPGWLGLKVQQVTPQMAIALGLPAPEGSLVANVVKGGQAEKAGLRIGDIITGFNGTTPRDERALLREISSTPPGNQVTLTVERGQRTVDLHAQVIDWPRQNWENFDAPIAPVKIMQFLPPDLGLKVTDLSAAVRTKLGIDPADPAVLIAAVTPGTDAARRGIAQGDALLRVQNDPVRSPAEFNAALAAARRLKRDFVLVLVWPQKQTMPGPEWYPVQVKP
jgi:serine protease Do